MDGIEQSLMSEAEILVVAKIVIGSSGRTVVTIQPRLSTPENLIRLAACYASHLGWALGDDENGIGDIYEAMLSQVVASWPETPSRFLASVPGLYPDKSDPEYKNKFAIEGGEQFSVALFQHTLLGRFVEARLAGARGAGPAGLAINLAWHYFLLLEEIIINLGPDELAFLQDVLFKLSLLLNQEDCDKTTQEGRLALLRQANQCVDEAIHGRVQSFAEGESRATAEMDDYSHVVRSYGEVLAERKEFWAIPESALPYPKGIVKRAILGLATEKSGNDLDTLRFGYSALASFIDDQVVARTNAIPGESDAIGLRNKIREETLRLGSEFDEMTRQSPNPGSTGASRT